MRYSTNMLVIFVIVNDKKEKKKKRECLACMQEDPWGDERTCESTKTACTFIPTSHPFFSPS